MVLSLSTGTEAETQSLKALHFQHVFNDGFIPQLCRSFMSSLSGESTWKELENRLNDKNRADFFRFNVTLTGQELQLDDTSCMNELHEVVHLQSNDEQK